MHHGAAAPVRVLELGVALGCLFGRDHGENVAAVDVPNRLCNDGIASAAVRQEAAWLNSWSATHL